jgi:NADPH:quinone reductase-like Zn-dependent oxidoreductase
VPSHPLTEEFSWFSAAATGAAFGTMLSGIAIDQSGSDDGQTVAIIGGVLAVGVAVVGPGRLAGVEADLTIN